MRAGIPCAFFAGSRKNGELAALWRISRAAAHTACALRRMKIGIIGKLAGMGDVITDDMAVYCKLGPEFVYDPIGAVQRACAVTPEDILARVAYEHTVFEIDPKLPPERHAESVRMYLGLKRYLRKRYVIYRSLEEFEQTDGSSIFSFLAASSLMVDGYGYVRATPISPPCSCCAQRAGRFQRDVYDGFCRPSCCATRARATGPCAAGTKSLS